MPGLGLASRVQVTAWHFWRRRNAAALSHHGVRMSYDPEARRAAALVCGVLFTVLCVAGAFILHWFKPAGQIGNAHILADRDSGQIYVMVDGRLQPTLNLASARLITGQSDNPTFVKADEIGKYPQGPMVGIVGAPTSMPIRTPPTATFTVCDTAPYPTPTVSAPPGPVVTLISGPLTVGVRSRPLPQGSVIITAYGGKTYAVTAAGRTEIEPAAGVRPVPISEALFDALPADPPGRKPAGDAVDTSINGTTCLSWSKGPTDRAATVTILSGQGLPIGLDADRQVVRIVKDGGNPVTADQVLIGRDAPNVVAATSAARDAASRETLWWISDQGVRYGIGMDDQGLKALGITTAEARQAPWVLIRLLAPGPQLSRPDALTQHGSLGAVPN